MPDHSRRPRQDHSAQGIWVMPPSPPGKQATINERYVRALHAEGLTVTQTASMFSGYPDTRYIHNRLTEGSLRGFIVDDQLRLLACQFTSNGQVPWVGNVVIHFPRCFSPLVINRFLTEPHDQLQHRHRGVSPREWLVRGLGSPFLIMEMAEHLGQGLYPRPHSRACRS